MSELAGVLAAMKPNEVRRKAGPTSSRRRSCLAYVLQAVRAIKEDVILLKPEAFDSVIGRVAQVGQIKLPLLDVVHP